MLVHEVNRREPGAMVFIETVGLLGQPGLYSSVGETGASTLIVLSPA